jgi:hypothetical protein
VPWRKTKPILGTPIRYFGANSTLDRWRVPKGKLLPFVSDDGFFQSLTAGGPWRLVGYGGLGVIPAGGLPKNPVSKPHMWANYFPFVRNVVVLKLAISLGTFLSSD